MLDRFVNQVQSSTNPSLDSLKKLAGLDKRKQGRDGKTLEPEFTDLDGILQIDVAKRMLKWHAEAIGRAVELIPQSDMSVSLVINPANLTGQRIPKPYSLFCLIILERDISRRFWISNSYLTPLSNLSQRSGESERSGYQERARLFVSSKHQSGYFDHTSFVGIRQYGTGTTGEFKPYDTEGDDELHHHKHLGS